MKKQVFLMMIAAAAGLTGCEPEADEKSNACDIVTFTVNGEEWNISNNAIFHTYPPETAATALTPVITLSPGATVNPPSGTAQNFFTEAGVIYTVTAEDGTTTKNYTVKATRTPYAACDIVSFTVNGTAWGISGTDITYTYPPETAATTLTPVITLSPGAMVNPPSGTAQNFFTEAGVTYTVTAEDGTTAKNYIAKAIIQPVATGTTGACTWTITGAPGSYTLTISGTGAMENYVLRLIDGTLNTAAGWNEYREGIKTVVIREGVTNIGSSAFYGCTGLTEIIISGSVTSIDISAFSLCEALTAFSVAENNTAYASIDGVLFNQNKKTLLFYPWGKTGSSYTIPGGVETIGDLAFSGATGLNEVIIPNSVTTIGAYAFLRNSSLTRITIGNGVTTIGAYAFLGCTGLTEITIPPLVTVIDTGVFGTCSSLQEIIIPDAITEIRAYAFQICTHLTDVTIPAGVTFIDADAFFRCEKLTAINVNAGNTTYASVGGVLFNKAQTTLITYPPGRDAYVIPDGVTTVGTYAFQYCTGLTGITIPASVTTIELGAFYRCTGLTSITNYNPVPQPVVSSVFGNNTTSVNKATCTLRVPAGSVAAYQAAAVWKDFVNIEAIP
jgi:hypothetical protein